MTSTARTGKAAIPSTARLKPTKPSEAALLSLGEGAKLYLTEAAGAGVRRIEARMAEAVTLAALHGRAPVDTALGTAAMVGRFAEGDLGSIIVHGAGSKEKEVVLPPPEHSLSAGTGAWSALGGVGADDEEDER